MRSVGTIKAACLRLPGRQRHIRSTPIPKQTDQTRRAYPKQIGALLVARLNHIPAWASGQIADDRGFKANFAIHFDGLLWNVIFRQSRTGFVIPSETF
jgi:hypothetical protein